MRRVGDGGSDRDYSGSERRSGPCGSIPRRRLQALNLAEKAIALRSVAGPGNQDTPRSQRSTRLLSLQAALQIRP